MHKWFIYFFPEREEENPAIKIGYSKHPLKRLKQLQTGHPTKIGCEGWLEVETEEDAKSIEKGFHIMFETLRIRNNGEWFKYNEDIKAFINLIQYRKAFTKYYY